MSWKPEVEDIILDELLWFDVFPTKQHTERRGPMRGILSSLRNPDSYMDWHWSPKTHIAGSVNSYVYQCAWDAFHHVTEQEELPQTMVPRS